MLHKTPKTTTDDVLDTVNTGLTILSAVSNGPVTGLILGPIVSLTRELVAVAQARYLTSSPQP